MDTKMEYEAPTLVEVGSFEEITQGASCPTFSDVANQVGDEVSCFS